MLCGEIIRSPNRSPYATLLSSLYPMMTAAVVEDDNLLENGRLSYENPNYHLAGTGHLALDDALNSNLTSATDSPAGFNLNDDCILYSELLCREFDTVCNINTDNINRKRYKSLDLGSMGVDVLGQTGKNWNTNLNRNVTRDMNITNQHDLSNVSNQNHQMQVSYVKPDLIEESEQTKCKGGNINEKRTPPNTLSLNKQKDTSSNINMDIQHIQGDLNNDLYAIPMKNNSHECTDELPAGWEKHEDNDGPYYWHIKSGTIQREPPEYSGKNEPKTPLVKDAESVLNSFQNNTGGLISSVTRSTTSSALENLCYQKNRKEDMAYKRRSYPARIENENKGIRFAVRSLGWVEICEDDLTPERSSKAVNKCIVDLSLGRNDFIDNVGRWGDGKDLFMDLDEGALKLIDPENLTVLNTQPIHTIRVWGVGRDNGRDFAYVARDRITRRHMCHVFRCDMPARTIANTLRDICKKIMIERSLQQNISRSTDINTATKMNQPVRPTNLPLEYRKRRSYRGSYSATTNLTQSFPTPMEEPRKVIRATYLGSIEVSKASGMDVLNDAIVALENSPTSVPQTVTVAVAPSMITIQQDTDEGDQMVECRVRYLSFLGIGQNIKQCAFIMHTTQDLFIAHVFECDPSAGTLCKTIEAACKLRYQKCLDAHPQGLNPNASLSHNINSPNVNGISRKGISSTLKSLVGTITGRKMKLTQS